MLAKHFPSEILEEDLSNPYPFVTHHYSGLPSTLKITQWAHIHMSKNLPANSRRIVNEEFFFVDAVKKMKKLQKQISNSKKFNEKVSFA